MTEEDDIIAVLSVSTPRRLFAAFVQGALGLLLLALIAKLPDPTVLGVITLAGFGSLSLYFAVRMYRATATDVILTRKGLHDSSGAEIAAIDNIQSVDKGFFAFKPSNGFLLRLATPRPGAWVPGVWWRRGTRVGIGGATNGKAARDMADIIMILKADPTAGFMHPPPET